MCKFDYQFEKFDDARDLLSTAHEDGETPSIVRAFHEISIGLRGVDEDELDTFARSRVRTLEELMDLSGVQDTTGDGLYWARAAAMSDEEKAELLKLVGALADWFQRKG
jgi:hypothetical protein